MIRTLVKQFISKHNIFLLITSITALCCMFAVQCITIARTDFVVAHHTAIGFEHLNVLGVAAAVAYGLVCLALLRSTEKEYPRIKRVISFGALICIVVAIITVPTRSQDVYWNLLLTKGYTVYGHNPYVTTPNMMQFDTLWSSMIRDWRDTPFLYGPLLIFFSCAVDRFVTHRSACSGEDHQRGHIARDYICILASVD